MGILSERQKNAQKRSQNAGLSTKKAKIRRERVFIYQDDDSFLKSKCDRIF